MKQLLPDLINQARVANDAGLTRSYISAVKLGTKHPNPKTRSAIIAAIALQAADIQAELDALRKELSKETKK